MVKGGFGTGAGGLAVPLMSIYIAPPEAAGIMLPILCAMDLFGVHAYRGRWSREHLRALLPGALVGIGARRAGVRRPAGQRDPAADRPDRRDVRAEQLVRLDRAPRRAHGEAGPGASPARSGAPPPDSPARWRTPAGRRSPSTCCRSGSTRRLLVGTSAVFFLVVNYVKLVPYAFLGQLNAGESRGGAASSRRSRRSASGSASGCTGASPKRRSTT